MTVEAKLNAGQPLDIYDAIFLSHYYPSVVKQLNPAPAPPLTPHERYEESMGRSYPSFEPQPPKQIVWPTETVTVGKSPTSAGRQVTIQRQPILESGPTLTGWLLGRSEKAKVAEQYLPSGVRTSKGLEAAAGLAYSVEGMVNPLTPFKLSGPFIGGMFVGIVGESYVVGKIVEPITKPYTEWLQAKGSSYLTKQYETAVEEGRPLSWKGPKERLVEIITHGRVESPRGPQIVDVPNASAVTEGKAGVIQIIIVAGITIVVFGFFWLVATAPVSSLIQLYEGQTLDADITATMTFIRVFISVLPLLCGVGVMIAGWVRTVEERETGFSSW